MCHEKRKNSQGVVRLLGNTSNIPSLVLLLIAIAKKKKKSTDCSLFMPQSLEVKTNEGDRKHNA